MEHRYTRDCPRPDYDEKITEWLNKQSRNGCSSMPYPVAIYHGGYIYRCIKGSGLGDYVSICEFLKSLKLVNMIADDATFRGYDAVFSTIPDKVDLLKRKFSLSDIPRNEPAK